MAEHPSAAARRVDDAEQDAKGRRLASAIGAEQAEDRAGGHGEADAVDGARLAEILDQIDGLDGERARSIRLARPVEALKFLRKSDANGVEAKPMIRGQSLEEAIRAQAERLGFVACGFTRADAADAAGLELKRWLEAGRHGTMGWMEERATSASARWRCGPRRSPRLRWP